MFRAKVAKIIFDSSPRQSYHFLRGLLLKQERLRHFDETHPCVFVLSTGRVGTQTLAALFDVAPNIIAHHEPQPELFGLSKLSYKHSDNKLMDEVLGEAFLTARRELLDYSLACRKGYVETGPQATFLAPVIFETLSNVRFIHMVREPQSVIISGMRRKWYDGHPYDNTRIVPRPESPMSREWNALDAFKKNVWLWTETNRWILDFLSRLPDNHKLLVHAEDVFAGDEDTMGKLFTLIGASPPSKRKILRVLGKKLNVQKRGAFPEPHTWSEAMHSDLRTMAGKTAKDLGYPL